jgi:hypothetical protein
VTLSAVVNLRLEQQLVASWLLAALALSGVAGCSDARPARVPVSGRVVIDGKPLTHGNVKFVPSGGRPSSGKVDGEGRFTLTCYDGEDGAIPGAHRVAVSAGKILSDSKMQWFAPKKYADFRTSGLSCEITEPTDNLTIELTWDGGKPFVE